MSLRTHKSRNLALLVPSLMLAANQAYASGFAILEQSSSRLGTAFAGTAATADDATAVYFNPAGMTLLDGHRAAMSLSDIYIDSKLKNANSQAAFGQPLGTEGGNAGGMNWVPSAYWTSKFGDRFALGIGVNAPFGLKLDYDDGWMGRFQAKRSEIKTLNINPSFAFRIGEVVSVGAGVNYQQIDAELTSAVNYSAVIAQQLQALALQGTITPLQAAQLTAANVGLEGYTVVAGDDAAWGFNVGVLFNFSDNARIGLAYRSSIEYTVEGDVRFFAPATPEPVGTGIVAGASAPGAPLSNSAASVELEVPASATLSYWQRLGSRVELMADVAWTEWSSIPELRVVRANGTTLSVTPEDWRDTWRAALGLAYTVNSKWKLRTGVAHDQTPVPDTTRTPRLPDGNRYWVAFGAGWAFSERISIDFGYTHLFVKDAPLDQNNGNQAAYGLINGEQKTSIDIVTAQLGYRF
jgi:long-chain fatty acid transport protein